MKKLTVLLLTLTVVFGTQAQGYFKLSNGGVVFENKVFVEKSSYDSLKGVVDILNKKLDRNEKTLNTTDLAVMDILCERPADELLFYSDSS